MSESVTDIRRVIDTLDNQIHDLLMQRADLVLKIGEEKRKNNVQVVQPDREIVMLRRLLARHKGPLPAEAVVRIWRELVGAVSLLQTGLKVIVAAPDDASGIIYWDMAKDYFSSVLPMVKAGNPLTALSAVREGDATFAVLPRPRDGETSPWWRLLGDEGRAGDKPMRIIARLPLGDRSSAGTNPEHQAVVVARLKFETSGDDRTFITLDLDSTISRARIVDRIKEAEFTPRSLCSFASAGRTLYLLEVDKFVPEGDAALAGMMTKLDPLGKAKVVGGYPVPPMFDDKVGKNAITAETEPKPDKSA